jgi:hypothetical protein
LGDGEGKVFLNMNVLRRVVFQLDNTKYGFFDLNDEERKYIEE